MKKFMFVLVLMLFSSVMIFAQEPEIPGDWGDVVVNLNSWFASLAGLAGITVFVAAFINKVIFKFVKTWKKQLIAELVAVLLAVGSSIANFGFLADAVWYVAILYGVGAGLVSNGFFDVPTVKALLKFLKLN